MKIETYSSDSKSGGGAPVNSSGLLCSAKKKTEKSWLYKQRYYRDSAWQQFQEFIAFQLIPFVIAAIIAVGVTLVLFSPVLLFAK